MKKILNNVTKLFFVAALLTTSTQAMAARLDLSQGTMSLGGTMAAMKAENVLKGGGALSYYTNLDFGYFVMDNLALSGTVGMGSTNLRTNFINDLRLGLGLSYFFDVGSIFVPYIGAGAVAKANIPASRWNFGARAQLGTLIALNKSVAINLGVKPTYYFTNGGSLDGVGGILGVVGFF